MTSLCGALFLLYKTDDEVTWRNAMLTGAALWYIGVPIPILILLWFFFLRGR